MNDFYKKENMDIETLDRVWKIFNTEGLMGLYQIKNQNSKVFCKFSFPWICAKLAKWSYDTCNHNEVIGNYVTYKFQTPNQVRFQLIKKNQDVGANFIVVIQGSVGPFLRSPNWKLNLNCGNQMKRIILISFCFFVFFLFLAYYGVNFAVNNSLINVSCNFIVICFQYFFATLVLASLLHILIYSLAIKKLYLKFINNDFIHEGYHQEADDILNQIETSGVDYRAPGSKWLFIGHSLGGGLVEEIISQLNGIRNDTNYRGVTFNKSFSRISQHNDGVRNKILDYRISYDFLSLISFFAVGIIKEMVNLVDDAFSTKKFLYILLFIVFLVRIFTPFDENIITWIAYGLIALSIFVVRNLIKKLFFDNHLLDKIIKVLEKLRNID